jgi:hypothetical protein
MHSTTNAIDKKSQIILITVFTLLGGMAVLFITLLPLTHQLISLKETTDSYQAIGNAEGGLELVFLKDFKNEDKCGGNECQISGSEEMEYNFKYQEITSTEGIPIKILSTGKKGRFERTLIFESE